MVNKKSLEDQISRLLRLPYAPSEARDAKELRGEFRSVLVNCSSDAHLVAVVDSLVRTRQNDGRGGEIARVPAPADVYAAMRQVHYPAETKPYIPRCQECRDYGFTGVDRAIDDSGWWTAGVAFRIGLACKCSIGRWFQEAQAEWLRMGSAWLPRAVEKLHEQQSREGL